MDSFVFPPCFLGDAVNSFSQEFQGGEFFVSVFFCCVIIDTLTRIPLVARGVCVPKAGGNMCTLANDD
jgi:hypothetical protein